MSLALGFCKICLNSWWKFTPLETSDCIIAHLRTWTWECEPFPQQLQHSMKSDAPEVSHKSPEVSKRSSPDSCMIAQQKAGLGGMRRSGILHSSLVYLGIV